MTFVAAAVPPPEVRREHETQVLADAEDVIVGILFDDIVRALLRPPTAVVPEPEPAATSRRERMQDTRATTALDRTSAAWARSPPGE
jgi:hypothetical protein